MMNPFPKGLRRAQLGCSGLYHSRGRAHRLVRRRLPTAQPWRSLRCSREQRSPRQAIAEVEALLPSREEADLSQHVFTKRLQILSPKVSTQILSMSVGL